MSHIYRRIDVTSSNGVPFRVILVPEGVPSPHTTYREGTEALVEFYDYRYADGRFTSDGQFVSRYYLRTILDVRSGLDLYMSEPSWKIDAAAMQTIVDWLKVEANR